MNVRQTLELQWPMDLERFSDYRDKVRGFFRDNLYWEDIAEDMVLGLDEALTNIVEHSCGDSEREGGEPIQMEVCLEDLGAGDLTHLKMLLKDKGPHGREFDMTRTRQEEAESHASAVHRMGYGIIFLHRLMDRVDYQVKDSGETNLLMQKWFSNAPPRDGQLRVLVTELQRLGALPPISEDLLEELARTHADIEIGEQVLILGSILDVDMEAFRASLIEARLNVSAGSSQSP